MKKKRKLPRHIIKLANQRQKILTNKEEEYERCVLCYQITNVKKDEPIETRPWFISACGQLCQQCAEGLSSESKGKEYGTFENNNF